jgi:hypothetical protein
MFYLFFLYNANSIGKSIVWRKPIVEETYLGFDQRYVPALTNISMPVDETSFEKINRIHDVANKIEFLQDSLIELPHYELSVDVETLLQDEFGSIRPHSISTNISWDWDM